MKIRIQDNSVRFRITIQELERLVADGSLISRTTFPAPASSVFAYGIRIDDAVTQSTIRFADGQIVAKLSRADTELLQDDSREGVYFPVEPHEPGGNRFIFFIEKDRPAAACDKPEQWIYEEVGGKPASVRPIAPSQD